MSALAGANVHLLWSGEDSASSLALLTGLISLSSDARVQRAALETLSNLLTAAPPGSAERVEMHASVLAAVPLRAVARLARRATGALETVAAAESTGETGADDVAAAALGVLRDAASSPVGRTALYRCISLSRLRALVDGGSPLVQERAITIISYLAADVVVAAIELSNVELQSEMDEGSTAQLPFAELYIDGTAIARTEPFASMPPVKLFNTLIELSNYCCELVLGRLTASALRLGAIETLGIVLRFARERKTLAALRDGPADAEAVLFLVEIARTLGALAHDACPDTRAAARDSLVSVVCEPRLHGFLGHLLGRRLLIELLLHAPVPRWYDAGLRAADALAHDRALWAALARFGGCERLLALATAEDELVAETALRCLLHLSYAADSLSDVDGASLLAFAAGAGLAALAGECSASAAAAASATWAQIAVNLVACEVPTSGVWRALGGECHPPARLGAACAAIGNCVAMFGGEDAAQKPQAELWCLDVRAGSWSQLPWAAGAPPRVRHACAAVGATLWVFGGTAASPDAPESPSASLLSFDLAAERWTEHAPAGQWPMARQGASLAACGSRLVLFGGYGHGAKFNDVWLIDTAAMPLRCVPLHLAGTAPSVRDGAALVALDSDTLLLHGGYSHEACDDAFLVCLSPPRWRALPRGVNAPIPRAGHGALRLGPRVCAIVGGWAASPPRKLMDVQLLSLTDNVWFELPLAASAGASDSASDAAAAVAAAPASPPPRSLACVAAVGSRIVVCGGADASSCALADSHVLTLARALRFGDGVLAAGAGGTSPLGDFAAALLARPALCEAGLALLKNLSVHAALGPALASRFAPALQALEGGASVLCSELARATLLNLSLTADTLAQEAQPPVWSVDSLLMQPSISPRLRAEAPSASVLVAAGTVERVSLTVAAADTVLLFSVVPEALDVDASWEWQQAAVCGAVPVLAPVRVSAGVAWQGLVVAPLAGIYTLVLSNQYSWLSSKQVRYTVLLG